MCDNFDPPPDPPTNKEFAKVQTHADIVKTWKRKIKEGWIPKDRKGVKTSLAVVYSLDTHGHNLHLIVPRKHENIPIIPQKWSNKRLNNLCYGLFKNVKITLTITPLNGVSDCLAENLELLPYYKQKGIQKICEGISRIPSTIAKFASEHPNISNNKIGCWLQLNLDNQLNLNCGKTDIAGTLFPWIVYDISTPKPTLVETILITDSKTWNIGKHLRFSFVESNIIDLTEQDNKDKEEPRKSHVSPNDLLEMDARWFDLLLKYGNIDTKHIHYRTLDTVGAYVANNQSKLPNGFDELFVCYHDLVFSWKEQHTNSKKKYEYLYQFMGLSVRHDWFNLLNPNNQSIFMQNCQEMGKSKWDTINYWLDISYNHLKKKDQLNLFEYMKNLTVDFPLSELKADAQVDYFHQLFVANFKDYLKDQWMLSIIKVNSVYSIISRVHVDKFLNKLEFGAGFELIIVVNTSWKSKNLGSIYINDCAIFCTSPVTIIQVSKCQISKVNGVNIFLSRNENSFVFMYRRIPTVVK